VDVLSLESMPLERIEAEITEGAGHLAAAECRWLLFVAEFDRREGWMAWGCRGCTQWLSWRCGIDSRTARDKLRVAHGLALFPRVREEFSNGRLSYTKARALIRVVSPETEEELVGMALHATGAHVESISRGYLRVARAEDRANGIDPARGRRVDFVADEGLRVQLFWNLAGLSDEVADHYLRQQRTELEWIRNAIRGSGSVSIRLLNG